MAFIRVQKLVRDESGNIKSGSASVEDTVYVSSGTKNHSRHVTREKLGRILYLSEDKKSGIFLSPTRGMTEYDAVNDRFSEVSPSDPRIKKENVFPPAEVHTVFGDVYLFLKFLEKSGLTAVLRNAFPKKELCERVICHLLHGVLKDGSRITCDNFIQKSFVSYLLTAVPVASLKSDTRYFTVLGDDSAKMCFFRTFISAMQLRDPDFGSACYVDSTPLPNAINDNPFNALCCHGVGSSEVMIRLVLVLDEKTGLPVWYDIIPGNVCDINTTMNVVNDVADNLGITINSLVLDAGYVSKELIHAFHIGTQKTVIGRMPAKKGYPYKELYWEVKSLIGKGKYAFVRNRHAYFGIKRKITIFNQEMYAYVYVDQNNALKHFSEYLVENEEEYESMKAKDKDWATVRYGFFILLSNIDTTPKELLTEYFGRTEIETVFKTSKEYLDLLPLSKWTDTTVRGKILGDIISTIALLNFRKCLSETGYSVSEIFGKTQSLMCCRAKNGNVTVETASKQVNEYYELFDVTVPSHVKVEAFRHQCLAV